MKLSSDLVSHACFDVAAQLDVLQKRINRTFFDTQKRKRQSHENTQTYLLQKHTYKSKIKVICGKI